MATPVAVTERSRREREPGQRTGTRLLVVLGLLAAVVVAVVSTTRSTPDDVTSVSYDRGSQALRFRAQTFAGETVDSAALRGTPLVLNFYASWCTVCDRELPDFQRVAEQLSGRVQVLGVNPQSNDTDAAQAAMVERAGVTYPTLRDPRDELLRAFNNTGGLPTTVFVDADGVVRKVHHGLLTEQLLLDEIATSLGVRG
jgi:cytochrome c biogenesis protein CcmG/thiol:disulfide interchange protein DsbE